MSITKSIGKNTLGGGKKMNVNMRTYERSTHNLSYAWRSTMGVGTLVPFMCEIGLPGDTWDIELNEKVLTHPTVGPLFGSYKLQMDVFTCPIRLYQAMLHNNKLGVGLDMSKVKLPQFLVAPPAEAYPENGNPYAQINPSALLAYLGRRGFTASKGSTEFCAVPEIAYYDVFKCYYANKQEENFYVMGNTGYADFKDNFTYDKNNNVVRGSAIIYVGTESTTNGLTYVFGEQKWNYTQMTAWFTFDTTNLNTKAYFTITVKEESSGLGYPLGGRLAAVYGSQRNALKTYKLTDIDDIREAILKEGDGQYIINQSQDNYLANLIKNPGESNVSRMNSSFAQYGLCLKTHQSDIFNNWINTEWIEGDNGISAITAIDTSAGHFTIDQLNLSKKVYDMLNRIAISGGTYSDWIETVYTNNYKMLPETPVYEGGASAEIIFQEVVATGGTETLGTLAGRGVSAGHKNGKLHINIAEPCILMGIVSITPRVDYCQGNAWHTNLKTMDDLHKPALDGIGYQDLDQELMAWWRDGKVGTKYTVGKQPAWLNYMTNFNKTYGNFAMENSEAFMVLNRWYYPTDETEPWGEQELNTTTYINPEDFNYVFADASLGSQNFWVQIGCGIKCRRKISAKQIPNL